MTLACPKHKNSAASPGHLIHACKSCRALALEALEKATPHWRGVLISVCSECHLLYDLKNAEGAPSAVSHGYCPECAEMVMKSLATNQNQGEKT